MQTDFALTNTTGIRAEIPPGPVTIEQMFNVFPFDNSITKMLLSGSEVQEVFDFAARRSASRGCVSQVQIAGARVAMNCDGCGPSLRPDLAITCTADEQCPFGDLCVDDPASPGNKRCKVACAQHVYIGRNEDAKCKTDNDCCNKAKDPACTGTIGSCDNYKLDAAGFGRCATLIDPIASYELATSNYIAQGGSGYSVLKRNTTQFDTGVQQRDALVDFMRNGHPCGWSKDAGTDDGLKACSVDTECGTDAVCACVGHVTADASGVCQSQGSCNGTGRCVLRGCRDGVASFHRRTCSESSRSDAARQSCEAELNPCELGGEECKFLSCIDQKVGNFTDGRLIMVGR